MWLPWSEGPLEAELDRSLSSLGRDESRGRMGGGERVAGEWEGGEGVTSSSTDSSRGSDLTEAWRCGLGGREQ